MGIWSGKTTEQAGPVVARAPGGPFPAGREPFPNWNLTKDGIPYYGNHVPCTKANADIIANEFAKDGADDATQQWATYIASREGGCNERTVNNNPATRDDSHCTFQLNALAGMFEPHGELGRRGWTVDNVKESMQNCADAASDLWVYCGRGPWTPPCVCSAVGRRPRRRRLASSATRQDDRGVGDAQSSLVPRTGRSAQEPAVWVCDLFLELGEPGLQYLGGGGQVSVGSSSSSSAR